MCVELPQLCSGARQNSCPRKCHGEPVMIKTHTHTHTQGQTSVLSEPQSKTQIKDTNERCALSDDRMNRWVIIKKVNKKFHLEIRARVYKAC